MFNGIGKGDFLSVLRIRIQSRFNWISGIRIREGNHDPQKRKKKSEEIHALKCCSLEVLHGGLTKNKYIR
jgi:hypothetical protein